MSEIKNSIRDYLESQSGQVMDDRGGQMRRWYSIARRTARAAFEVDTFPPEDRGLAETIADIVAEMTMIPSGATVSIEGIAMPSDAVMDVYSELTREHVALVIENFRHVTYRIRHIKSYLRTALYNSVFELDARIENDVAADLSKP